MKKPYVNWTKEELFWHLKKQAIEYKCCHPDMFYLIKQAVYDERWNPSEQFNGCNFVQDDLHPFLPCFVHDWRWITNQDVKASNKEFEHLLLEFGYSKWKAKLYYIGVTMGWHCYYKWI